MEFTYDGKTYVVKFQHVRKPLWIQECFIKINSDGIPVVTKQRTLLTNKRGNPVMVPVKTVCTITCEGMIWTSEARANHGEQFSYKGGIQVSLYKTLDLMDVLHHGNPVDKGTEAYKVLAKWNHGLRAAAWACYWDSTGNQPELSRWMGTDEQLRHDEARFAIESALEMLGVLERLRDKREKASV